MQLPTYGVAIERFPKSLPCSYFGARIFPIGFFAAGQYHDLNSHGNSSKVAIPESFGLQPGSAVDKEDSLADKLSRECSLLVHGTVNGIGEGLKGAVEHPLTTAAEALTAAGVGAGLTAMEMKVGFRPGVWLVSGALLYGLAKDVLGRAQITGNAIADTWNSPNNLDKNTKVVGDTIGPFVVDTMIAGAGAHVGSSMMNSYLLGPNGKYTRIPTLRINEAASAKDNTLYLRKDPFALLYEDKKDSIVKISRWQDNGKLSGNFGTGFFVSQDGKIATNAHVVDQHTDFVITTNSGDKYWAKVLGVDHAKDVAVLGMARDNPGIVFKPLTLSAEPLNPADKVAIIGFPQNNTLHRMFISPGEFVADGTSPNLVRVPQDLSLPNASNVIFDKYFPNMNIGSPGQRVTATFDAQGNVTGLTLARQDSAEVFEIMNLPERNFAIHAEPGNSGSPVFNMKGDVIAITTKGNGANKGMGSHSDLVKQVLEKHADSGEPRLPAMGDGKRLF